VALLGTVLLTSLGGLEWARAREKRHQDALQVVLDRSRRSEEEARDQRALADRQRGLAHRHWTASQLKLASSLCERGDQGAARSILDSLGPSPGLSDARGFAWQFLDRLCPRIEMLAPLPQGVWSVAHARDGRTIALADAAGALFLLDRDTGQLRATRTRHRLQGIALLVFSPDGRTLASLAHGITRQDQARSEVKLWDVDSGAELEGMAEDFAFCYQLVFSPDSWTLVTVEATSTNREAPVRSWKLSDDRRRVTPGESLRADQLSVSLAPARRAAHRAPQPFRFSDVLTMTSGDNPTLAVWQEDGEIRLYGTRAGYWRAVCHAEESEVVVLPRHDLPVPYSPAEVAEIARVAGALTGRARARPISHEVPVYLARFARDGRTAAVMVWSPDRPSSGRHRLIDVGTGRVALEHPWGDVWAGCGFEFAPEGDALVVIGFDNRARRWSFHDWRAPGILRGHPKEVWSLAFSPDGTGLASAADDHTLKLWDVATGRERATLAGHGSLVTAVASSPDGVLLASAGFDTTVRLWSAATGKPLATLQGHTDRVRTVAFAPDGKILASAGNDGGIRLWDVTARQELSPSLPGHTEPVFAVAFSPDGKTLFSGSMDQTIRAWDWRAGQVHAVWLAADQVYSLAVSPDGQILAAAHKGGIVTLWDLPQAKARPPPAGAHGRRARPGLQPRRPHAGLGRAGPDRPPLGPGYRSGVDDAHRARGAGPRRGILTRRHDPRDRQPRRWDQAVAGCATAGRARPRPSQPSRFRPLPMIGPPSPGPRIDRFRSVRVGDSESERLQGPVHHRLAPTPSRLPGNRASGPDRVRIFSRESQHHRRCLSRGDGTEATTSRRGIRQLGGPEIRAADRDAATTPTPAGGGP
jgi:WD40 repeat protein